MLDGPSVPVWGVGGVGESLCGCSCQGSRQVHTAVGDHNSGGDTSQAPRTIRQDPVAVRVKPSEQPLEVFQEGLVVAQLKVQKHLGHAQRYVRGIHNNTLR